MPRRRAAALPRSRRLCVFSESFLHNKIVPIPTPVILSKVINGVPIVDIVVSNPNLTMSFVVFQPACTPRPTFQFDMRFFFEQAMISSVVAPMYNFCPLRVSKVIFVVINVHQTTFSNLPHPPFPSMYFYKFTLSIPRIVKPIRGITKFLLL